MVYEGYTLILTLVIFFINSTGVYGINITDCGSSGAKIHELMLSGEKEDLCPLYRGSTTNVTIKFEVYCTMEKLDPDIRGTINDGKIFFPLPSEYKLDCTPDKGLNDPFVPGEIYTCHTSIKILEIYPLIKTVVKFRLKEGKKTVICVLIPCYIDDE